MILCKWIYVVIFTNHAVSDANHIASDTNYIVSDSNHIMSDNNDDVIDTNHIVNDTNHEMSVCEICFQATDWSEVYIFISAYTKFNQN